MAYGIIYSTASKMIRRIITEDAGNVVSPNAVTVKTSTGTHALAAGESALIVANVSGVPHTMSDWMAQVQGATGVVPPSPACAVVDGTNTVIAMVCADPAIDTDPSGHTLVSAYSPLVTIGCTYTPATGLFTAPAFTIPAGAPGNKGSALPKNVAAAVIPKT